MNNHASNDRMKPDVRQGKHAKNSKHKLSLEERIARLSDLGKAAVKYAQAGFKVHPLCGIIEDPKTGELKRTCNWKKCESPGKHPLLAWKNNPENAPTNDVTKVVEWWEKWPNANIGGATGAGKDCVGVVIDIDGPKGEELLAELEKEHPGLSETASDRSGRGRRLFFTVSNGPVRTIAISAHQIDVKGDGGYIVLPPSRHHSGRTYEWTKSIFETPRKELPEEVLQKLRELGRGKKEQTPKPKPQREGKDADHKAEVEACEVQRVVRPWDADEIPDGQRYNTLTAYIRHWLNMGAGREEVRMLTLALNKQKCKPVYDEKYVNEWVDYWAGEWEAERAKGLDPDGRLHLTDLGNAKRFVAHHGANVRFCHLWGKWLLWDGTRWKCDETGYVRQLAKDVALSIHREADVAEQNKVDENIVRAIRKHAQKTEGSGRIQAMLFLAQSEVPAHPDTMDKDPWLFNCLNGTIDLRTGELRPHDKRDMITKLAPVHYDPEAQCPRWLAFLEEIMDGDQDLIAYLQRFVGYALTGITKEQCFHIFWGSGANGKTTFLEAVQKIFGDYGQTTQADTFMVQRPGAVTNDVAKLRGARFVAAAESAEGRRLDEALIKRLTGGDTISARFLYAEPFEFKPQCKIVIATNHKPDIRGQTSAIWRRMRLVPFTVQIPPEEQDRELGQKLEAELPGILAWAVRGCLEWQRQGLQPPEAVTEATEGYRSEMDTIGDFIDECCVVHP
ncbi:phage/plasmid primase, P4 family, partial [Desulfosoma caldarium]